MGYDLIGRYNCGVSVENTTPEEIASRIKAIKELKIDEYNSLCMNAKEAAKNFDIPTLAEKYLNEIEGIINKYNLRKQRRNK